MHGTQTGCNFSAPFLLAVTVDPNLERFPFHTLFVQQKAINKQGATVAFNYYINIYYLEMVGLVFGMNTISLCVMAQCLLICAMQMVEGM